MRASAPVAARLAHSALPLDKSNRLTTLFDADRGATTLWQHTRDGGMRRTVGPQADAD